MQKLIFYKNYINTFLIALLMFLANIKVLANPPWEDGQEADELLAELYESLGTVFNYLALIGFLLFGIAIIKFMRNRDQGESLSKSLIGFGLLALAPTIVRIIFSLTGGSWF